MTETKSNLFLYEKKQFNQLDLLYEIYKLRIVRKKLIFKLRSLEKTLKSRITSELEYKFEALKTIITENSTKLKNLLGKVGGNCNLFDLTKNFNKFELYIENLITELKKKHIDLETFELTKGHYLKQILDIQDCIRQLKVSASAYSRELREELIMLEDKRIRLTTEKMRKNITKEDFKEQLKEIDNLKQIIEEKLAFLKIEILDIKLGGE
jgi:hypothetical protein